LNPWSAALFETPKITQLIGDSFDLVQQFDDGAFSRIVHDPPMFNLAGELYSAEFYRHLYRVLARNGRLFHYVGNPDSPSGSRVTRGVVRRLQEAGFTHVRRRPDAFGVLAQK
jgi:predicted methyltransferase